MKIEEKIKKIAFMNVSVGFEYEVLDFEIKEESFNNKQEIQTMVLEYIETCFEVFTSELIDSLDVVSFDEEELNDFVTITFPNFEFYPKDKNGNADLYNEIYLDDLFDIESFSEKHTDLIFKKLQRRI